MLKRLFCALLIVILVGMLSPGSVSGQASNWLPAPTGPYQIGTTTYHWVDESRPEIFTEDPDDRRELLVRVWYPAEVDVDATPEPYGPHPDVILSFPMTSITVSADIEFTISAEDLVLTPTHSYRDAPVADGAASYPVLVFSHGSVARPEFYAAQIEELASQGYIVVGIVHTHIAMLTVFPDGRIVPFSNPDGDLAVEVGAQDQSFVLDQLTLLNDASATERFSGRLELDRVGSFGQSWGAAVALLACLQDSRFTAAIPEDGPFPDAVAREGLDLPVMFMKQDGRTASAALPSLRGPAYNLIFDGFGHMDFTDFTLYPGISSSDPHLVGGVEGSRAAHVVNAYLLAFFDQYLKGEESPLLNGPSSDYPEVEFEARNLQ
jgi:predicted dienelactone hydrolase